MQREEGRIKALEYFEGFSKEEKLTWVEIIFDDVKGGGEKNGISPSIPTKQNAAGVTDNVWREGHDLERAPGGHRRSGRGRRVVASWIHVSALGSAHLFLGRGKQQK